VARTTTQLRDLVALEGGFDATLWNAAIVGWLDDRHKQLVAEAKWKYADDYSLGTTTANVAVYTVVDDLVQVAWLEVGGVRYERTSSSHIDRLHDVTEYSVPSDQGWFAEGSSATGAVKQVRLYPTPTVSGTAITAKVSLVPADLDTSSVNPVVPEDFEETLIAGALAVGEARVNKRPDMAQFHEQAFQDGIARLRKRRIGRFGQGPVAIPVKGYQFR
jgi:hypothetical protein